MNEKNIKLDDSELKNTSFINVTVVSNKVPFGKQDFKYFIGY